MKGKLILIIIFLQFICYSSLYSLTYRSLRVAIPGNIGMNNPGELQTYSDRCITYHAFETLVIAKKNSIQPNLISAWQHDNYKSWVLTVEKEIKFHDNSILKPQDIKNSILKINTSLGKNNAFKNIKNISINGGNSLKIDLIKPDTNFLSLLSLPQASIWKSISGWPMPVGTGPFYIEEIIEDRASLISFKGYRKGEPEIQRLEFIFVTSNQSMVQLFKQKQVHICSLSIEEYLSCSGNIPKGASIIKKTTDNIVILRMNDGHPLFKKQSVMKGITASLGRKTFDVLLAGQLNDKVGWYPFSRKTIPLKKNIKRAQKYLKANRIPPSMTIKYVSIFGSEYLIFNKIATQLEDAGFTRIKTEPVMEKDMKNILSEKDFEFSGEIIYGDIDLANYYKGCSDLHSYIPLYRPMVNILFNKKLSNFKIHPNGVLDFKSAYWKHGK